jgi:hypothetical protein
MQDTTSKQGRISHVAGSVMLQDLSCHVFGARFIPTLVFDSTTESRPAFYLGCLYVVIPGQAGQAMGLKEGKDYSGSAYEYFYQNNIIIIMVASNFLVDDIVLVTNHHLFNFSSCTIFHLDLWHMNQIQPIQPIFSSCSVAH